MEFPRIKEIRNENKMTQKEIAKALNMNLGTYAMNELGHDTITIANLTKFCDYYNISVDYLFELTNNKNYSNSKQGFNKEILKTRLKEWRLSNNFTQNKIGKILNIDHSVWCRYEQGKTTIPTTFLYTICSEFNESADFLLGRIDKN